MRRVALLALGVALAACSGGEGDSSASATAATGAGVTATAEDPVGDLKACDLVTLEQVSAIYGEPAALGDVGASTLNQCVWVTQASIDEPTLDNAGDVLSLTVVDPPGGAYPDAKAYWPDLASFELGSGGAVERGLGDEAVRNGARFSVRDGDVVLSTSAGVGTADPGAVAASRALMEAALDGL